MQNADTYPLLTHISHMKKAICRIILKMMGWKAVGGPAPEDKCIILGAPHTSWWDFVISYLFYASVGGKAYILIKKEFFKWPLGPILKALGGVPVDRGKGASLALQVIHAFETHERMHLAIAPEGTRNATSRWKTGFHTIAKATGVPVYLGYFDWGRKEVGRGEKFMLSDDAQADLKKIRQWYKDKGVTGKHPEMFTTGDDLE